MAHGISTHKAIVNHFWVSNKTTGNVSNRVSRVATLAMFLAGITTIVVLSMGVAGKFPMPAFKWTVIALSGTLLASSLLIGGHGNNKTKMALIVSVISTLVALAVLQHFNILSYKQAATGMLCTLLGAGFLAIMSKCGCCCCSVVSTAFKNLQESMKKVEKEAEKEVLT